METEPLSYPISKVNADPIPLISNLTQELVSWSLNNKVNAVYRVDFNSSPDLEYMRLFWEVTTFSGVRLTSSRMRDLLCISNFICKTYSRSCLQHMHQLTIVSIQCVLH